MYNKFEEAKFVIFGTGVRAKRICSLIGKDRVVAFLDNYPKDRIFLGRPVLSIEDYLTFFEEYIIIISQLIYDSIVLQLRDREIYQYFVYDECPREYVQDIQIEDNVNKIKEYILKMVPDKERIIVSGCSLFSLITYEWLIEKNIDVSLNLNSSDTLVSDALISRLNKYSYDFSFYDNSINKVARLMCTKECLESNREEKDCINAYDLRKAIGRAKDLGIESYYNIHSREKRCFIIATGPSIRISDLDYLDNNNQICISMNKVFYSFDETEWRPDYYMASDPLVISRCREEILSIEAKAKFIGELEPCFWKDCRDSNIYRIHQERIVENGIRFSTDISYAFAYSSTVTFLAIQLAVYMGFKRIYLLGVDHTAGKSVNSLERHFYREKDIKAFNMRMEPSYMDRVEEDYIEANKYANSHGIKIYNATRGGNLEVFERVDIDELFEVIRKEKGLK